MSQSARQGERSLGGVTLLNSLSPADLATLDSRCRWRVFERNEIILDKGSTSREVFFVVKGGVAVVTFSSAGREVTLATVKVGDFFGELAAIDGEPRSASITALERTELAIMPAQSFMDLVTGRPDVAQALLVRLARLVRMSGVRILELSTLQAAPRVYSELLRMAQPEPAVQGLWVVRPLPPMHEIASLTGTTRETVNRAISQLYPSGLLKRKGRNLYLMDKARLQEMVLSLQAHNHK